MDKNENGYPITDINGRRIGSQTTPNGGNGCSMGNQRAIGGSGNECGGTSCVDAYPLAYVYAPNQNFRLLYSAEEALKHGTLFEELYKPKEVYGRE